MRQSSFCSLITFVTRTAGIYDGRRTDGTDGQRTDDDDDDGTVDGTDGRTKDDDGDDGTRRDERTEDGRRRWDGRWDGRRDGRWDGRWDGRTDRGRRRRRRDGRAIYTALKFQVRHRDHDSNVPVCRPRGDVSGHAQ